MLDRIAGDLKFAARMLRKSPVFTVVAVLAISLGSGAVTTIFSAMNALLFRPVPGTADGARLISFAFVQRNGHRELQESYSMYQRLRDEAKSVSGLAAWRKITLSIASGDGGFVAAGNLVSGNYFSVLGVRPELGRFFLPEEDETPLAHPVIVVSHAFWATKLGGDRSVVGKTVRVNGNPFTLIGVAPDGFVGVVTPVPADGWVPLSMQAALLPSGNLTTARLLRIFGRLKADASDQTAAAEISALVPAAAADNPTVTLSRRSTGARVSPLRAIPEDAYGKFLAFMALLLGAAGFVLVIASVNVAALLSARAVARRREMALRAALGAGRGRLVAQLLTEVLLLFVLGAAGGVAFTFLATHAAAAVTLPVDVISAPDMTPDLRVMAFALAVSLLTGLVFGLAPALSSARDDIVARLRDGSTGSGTRRGLAANALIVGQLSLSLVLLVAAGLFLRALSIGTRVDPGFERAGLSVATFDAQTWGYDDAKAKHFYRDLLARVAAAPGVANASYASFAPLTTRSMNDSIKPDGAEAMFTWLTNVGADYFATMRLPLVAGRSFAVSDDERAPRVAVVNETLAKRLAPGGSALGRSFDIHGTRTTIVGIARDAKYADLSEDTPSMVYFPMEQRNESTHRLLIRGTATPAQLSTAIRDAMQSLDRALPRPSVATLEKASEISLLPQRIAAVVTASLGSVGLLLATLGLYGIIAYSVNRRIREMGIRIALGARRRDVLRLVMGEGMRLAVLGVVIGVVLAAAATRLIAGYLFDVSPLDALTFGGMSGLFVLIALAATYLPARRASQSDPMTALRSE